MDHFRRQFVIASTTIGSVLVAGCLDQSLNGADGNGSGDENTDDTTGDGGDWECNAIYLSLIDEPPHDPERPPQPEDIEDEAEWDDHHLGEGMDDDSDLSFDRISLRLDEPKFDQTEFNGGAAFYADLITSREAFEERVNLFSDESKNRLEDVDFEEEAIVVVLSGFGSSSVGHEWVRVDENCGEVHVHGYYVWPYIQTADYTQLASGVVIEKPAEHDLERAWVSVTVAEDTRANFHTDAGVQAVSDEDSDEGGGEIDEHGAVDHVAVVSATREFAGDWDSSERDDIGVVVHLDEKQELRAVVDDHKEVDRFVAETDFENDAVYYLESAGPSACYQEIRVSDVQAIADDTGYFARGNAAAVDVSDDHEDCAAVVSYPGVLIRVESEVEFRDAEFEITDGWGEQRTVESKSMAELAQE